MLLREVVASSAAVAATSSRLAKRETIAGLLRRTLGEDTEDIEVVVAYLCGALPQRRTGVGVAGLAVMPTPAEEATLTVAATDEAFAGISGLFGVGSAAHRTAAVTELFGAATAEEQQFLRGLVSGDIRQGALESAMVDAVAVAADVPLASVRRAVMLRGSVVPVAVAALQGGAPAVAEFALQVGRPVRPMLASSAPDLETAWSTLGGQDLCLDAKLDGIRIQVHKDARSVRVFTRSLDDITARLPEVVAIAESLPADRVVLDGEAMTLTVSGRPRPFQQTAARTARRLSAGEPDTQVAPFFFDIMHRDGVDLIDLTLRERLAQLADLVPTAFVVPRLTPANLEAGQQFFEDCLAVGHEGVVVKALGAAYEAGRRGRGWVKVKPRHTLDLVVLAVEWGSGRRTGLLSNIHLGARDPQSGGFVMLGKTFKGMTDAMLTWQTRRFLELEVSRSAHVVAVRPEQVVEVAFDGLQQSRRYAGGWALRFARVVRYRDDKAAADADTMDTIRELGAHGVDSG